jgi:hydroxymethylbilane synthase
MAMPPALSGKPTGPQQTLRLIRIGTRTSQLALWQSKHVAALLEAAWPHVRCELVPLITQGDRRLDRPLPEIGGKGLFTAELEEALRHRG